MSLLNRLVSDKACLYLSYTDYDLHDTFDAASDAKTGGQVLSIDRMEVPLSYSVNYDLVPDPIAITATPLSMKTLSKRRTIERQSTAMDDMEKIDCSLPYVMPQVGFQSV